MKEMIDEATRRAITFNADGATQRFYQGLKEGKFQSTRCNECGHIPYPPRLFCPSCGHEDVTWVDLPSTGTLYAFTQQARSLRFPAPDVLGLVELAGIGLVLTHIDAELNKLRIGQTMAVDFFAVSSELVVHQFRPA